MNASIKTDNRSNPSFSEITYDLHTHTSFSDGQLTPEELINRAVERNIDLLAITDHDSLSGLQSANDYCNKADLGINIINGIELSASSDFGDIHIVGLGIDLSSVELLRLVEQQKRLREERAKIIDEKLSKAGIKDILNLIKQDGVELVTRSHFAQKLIKEGHAKDNNQVFKRYLGRKGKAKVKNSWESMQNCIEVITKSGGVAVLAHPTRYAISNRKLSYLIEEFKLEGGLGIEVSYPSLNPDEAGWLEVQRKKNDMLASAGSDFHFPDLKWSDLGKFRPVKKDTPHVLDQLSLSL